jgi:hypothetical protein
MLSGCFLDAFWMLSHVKSQLLFSDPLIDPSIRRLKPLVKSLVFNRIVYEYEVGGEDILEGTLKDAGL